MVINAVVQIMKKYQIDSKVKSTLFLNLNGSDGDKIILFHIYISFRKYIHH